MWSDEAYIYLGNDQGHVFITWHMNEEFLNKCLVLIFKQSLVYIIVWGCIMEKRKGSLVVLKYPGGKSGGMNMKRYCEQVLEDTLVGFYNEVVQNCDQVLFQQDNASCYTSKQNLPNLSPIEPV